MAGTGHFVRKESAKMIPVMDPSVLFFVRAIRKTLNCKYYNHLLLNFTKHYFYQTMYLFKYRMELQ